MKIEHVAVVPWSDGDERWIRESRVIGRASLGLAGGGVVHALVLDDGHEVRAVYLNREKSTFETVSIGSRW